MQIYKVKILPVSGSNYREVYKKSSLLYKENHKQSRRRSFVRSAYFNNQKVFLELFWNHLHEKLNLRDKARRVKYFGCAIELIQKSHCEPVSKENVDRRSELLHRFTGETKTGQIFFVQIKEEKRTGEKWLVSIFPLK